MQFNSSLLWEIMQYATRMNGYNNLACVGWTSLSVDLWDLGRTDLENPPVKQYSLPFRVRLK